MQRVSDHWTDCKDNAVHFVDNYAQGLSQSLRKRNYSYMEKRLTSVPRLSLIYPNARNPELTYINF